MSEPEKIRMTRQRKIILEDVRTSRNHPTAYEVYESVRKRLPNISLGTVYRNLETLSENGVIRRLELPESKRRYDGRLSRHYHVKCTRCGKVEDLKLDPMEAVERTAGETSGYKIIDHQLEFSGICPECQGK